MLKIQNRRIASRFRRLAREWKTETAHLSSVTQRAVHPAYQRIIGMGEAAIPYILRELQDEPDDWFWALNSITEEDPVPPKSRGKMQRMTQMWLKWGRDHGYAP